MKDKQLEREIRLQHMLKAIDDIQNFTKHETLKSFCENSILNNAVLYNFTIMGEAVIHIENEKLKKYNYPWYKVRSFRNMIAHEYFNIKLSSVWEIIQQDLPELKTLITTILDNEY